MSSCILNRLFVALVSGWLFTLPSDAAAGTQGPSKRSPEESRAAAVAVLEQPQASDYEKAKACQTLAHVGDRAAVPALARLLADPELANYARHALEGIADPTAAQALRTALGSAEGDLRIGIVASLGHKADVASIADLSALLNDENDRLAAAAANSLGEIGTIECADALLSALKKSAGRRSIDLAQAGSRCGQQLLERGEAKAATKIFQQLTSQQNLPSSIAAGAIVAQSTALGTGGLPLLIKEIQLQASTPSADNVRFQAVATSLGILAQQFSGQQLQQLLESSEPLSAQRRALILQSVSPTIKHEIVAQQLPVQIRQWASDKEPGLRAACMQLLALSDRPADVQAVLDAATSDQPAVSSAARHAVEQCSTNRFDSGIVQMLGAAEPDLIATAIDLAERRRLSAVTVKLESIANDARHPARLLAVKALGSTIDVAGLGRLLELATAGAASNVRSAARDGVAVALVRLPQAESARALEKLWQSGSVEAKVYALEKIGDVGGPTALETLEQAVLSRNAAMQDAGSRVLGECMSPDAAPLLLKLARTLDDSKLKLRSLRGALRIARQLDIPLKDRLAICQQALELSSRDDERKLVLDIYRQYASVETLTASFEMAARESMRGPAVATAQAIAPRAAQQDGVATRAALHSIIATAKSSDIKQHATALLGTLTQPKETDSR